MAEKRGGPSNPPNFQAVRRPISPPPRSPTGASQTDDDNEDLPPGYSMAAPTPDPAQQRNAALGRLIPGNIPNVNFAAYAPLGSEVSSDLRTTTIVNQALCSSPQAFAKVLAEQIALVPVPEVRIRGVHKEYGSEVVDFDLRINMMRYFLPKDGSPSLHYTQLNASGKDRISISGIEEWARGFCTNSATDKRFLITRKLTNWDSDTIIGRIHGLCQQVNYKGTVTVTIPVLHSRTVLKTTASIGAIFKSHFMPPEKYELDVFWPYASHAPTEDSDEDQTALPGASAVASRKCLVRSENGWFKDWRPALRAAILNKKTGWVGIEDWIEFQLRQVKQESKPDPWGVQK